MAASLSWHSAVAGSAHDRDDQLRSTHGETKPGEGSAAQAVGLRCDIREFFDDCEMGEEDGADEPDFNYCTIGFHSNMQSATVKRYCTIPDAGEKNICFSIPTATVIFIDIVKFREYATNFLGRK
jgi:hypothetical protein